MSAKPMTQTEWFEYLAKTWVEAVSATYKEQIEAAVRAERRACYTIATFNQSNHLEHLTPEQILARGPC